MPRESKKVVESNDKKTKDIAASQKETTASTTRKAKSTSAKKKLPIDTNNHNTKIKKISTKESNKKESKKQSLTKQTSQNKENTSISKTLTARSTRKKMTSKSTKTGTFLQEYYDLPYRYNDTIVRVLAQTPTTLFIYWDISDATREKWLKDFGEDFLNNTKPVLIIHNETKDYHYEIEIDDFANSWYLEIPDARCQYRIELGRRPKAENYSIPHVEDNYIYVTSSNEIEAPNDHILFEKIPDKIQYKNIKNNKITYKKSDHMPIVKGIKKIYPLYDLYHEIYRTEISEGTMDLKNPSSGNSSSTFQ